MILRNALFQNTVESTEFLRIIEINYDTSNVAYIVIQAEKTSFPTICQIEEFENLIISSYLFIPSNEDPFINALNLTPSKREKERISERYTIINYLIEEYQWQLFTPVLRNRIIKRNKKKYSKRTIERFLKLFWKYGQLKISLSSKYVHCGSRGNLNVKSTLLGKKSNSKYRMNICDQDRKNIMLALKDYPAKIERNIKLSHIYEYMLSIFYLNKNHKLIKYPSIGQFYYWVNKLLPKPLRTKKWNPGHYERNIRPLVANADKDTFAPGHKYEIDSTQTDFYLTSSNKKGFFIGRAILFLVVDVFTRYIVGYYLGMRNESYFSGNLALLNAFSSKVEYCKKIGIEITEDDWYPAPVCKKLVGDRGPLHSKKSDLLVESTGMEVDNTRPFRGDEKPFVERFLGLVQDKVKKYMKGQNVVPPLLNERIDFDEKKHTWITLDLLNFCTVKAILSHNNFRPLRNYPFKKEIIGNNVELLPSKIWSYYRDNNNFYGKTIPPKLLRMLLLEKKECSHSRGKIYLNKKYFSPVDLSIGEELVILKNSKPKQRLEVFFDPADINDVHLHLNGEYHKLQLIQQTIDEIKNFYQLNAILKYESDQIKKLSHGFLENEVNNIRETEELSTQEKNKNLKKKNNTKEVRNQKDKEIDREISRKHEPPINPNKSDESDFENPYDNPIV